MDKVIAGEIGDKTVVLMQTAAVNAQKTG